MERKKIVEKWADENVVENIIKNNFKSFANHPYINDLTQDIYITLLATDESILQSLNESGEYVNYVKRVIKNNIYSTTSPFYYRYEKFRKITDNIDETDEGL